jgi:hypothetical protein
LDRPLQVRRFRRGHPSLLAAALVFFGGLFVFWDLPTPPARADGADHLAVRGTVVRAPDHNGNAEVEYRHPVTGQLVEEDINLWQPGRLPRVGEDASLVVSATDPRDVDLAGDDMPGTTNLPEYAVWVVAAAIPLGVRRFTVWRTERLARSNTTTFSMLAVLGPPGRWRRRAVLHLYPLDAEPGALPVCSLPVLTTSQLPLGHVLDAAVKGSPRPMGRAVARVGGEVLWPARRALRSGSLGLPAAVGPPPYGLAVAASPVGRSWRPGSTELALPLLGLLGAIVLLGSVGFVTARNERTARVLGREGIPAVGTVVENDDDWTVVLEVDRGGVDSRVGAPVDFPEDYPVGRRFPIFLDPEDPRRARLAAEPYDALEPVIWASVPLAAVFVWLLVELLRWWRAARAVRSGQWWSPRVAPRADGSILLDELDRPVCVVRGTPPVLVVGQPEPGGFVATFDADGRSAWAGIPSMPAPSASAGLTKRPDGSIVDGGPMVVPIRTYRFGRRHGIEIENGLVRLVMPKYFGTTPMEVPVTDVAVLDLGGAAVDLPEGAGFANLPTTSDHVSPTVALLFARPLVLPRKRFALHPSGPVDGVLLRIKDPVAAVAQLRSAGLADGRNAAGWMHPEPPPVTPRGQLIATVVSAVGFVLLAIGAISGRIIAVDSGAGLWVVVGLVGIGSALLFAGWFWRRR